MKSVLALIAMLAASPAFARDIGHLAPLAAFQRGWANPYAPYYYQPPPQPGYSAVIPDGFGGYNVISPGRPSTFVIPDGFGGYTIMGR